MYKFFVSLCLLLAGTHNGLTFAQSGEAPRIVNIINFIRLLEPRDASITKDVLYQTVVEQIRAMRTYQLPGTFLLQYDALMDPRYQALLKTLPKDSFEIGAWWEIPQPLVEKAGLVWRGRYPWDWHADVGFSTGYSQPERKKLIDVYMTDFREVFGYYPQSVGSWFIDAYSINYMYERYHILASSNCKDQYGTDGYTLWGGYWNQAYYPSKVNAYMPAQHASKQIPVPVFRMLGSDPIRQYDTGLGNERQNVITLEPVYPFGGGDTAWVEWFFNQLVRGEPLAFAYAKAGQENSFTWAAMKKGFDIQMPLIQKLRDDRKIQVETLAQSGTWFREHFSTTPATAVTVTEDIAGSDRKTVWFNSRYYRVNFLWEEDGLRIRDIHLFDEDLASPYFSKKAISNECRFFTLPLVDGYLWSNPDTLAGMRLYASTFGQVQIVKGGTPQITKNANGYLEIRWPLTNIPGAFLITCDEKNISFSLETSQGSDWYLDLRVKDPASLPFQKMGPQMLECRFENFKYRILLEQGNFMRPMGDAVLRLSPENGKILLRLDGG